MYVLDQKVIRKKRMNSPERALCNSDSPDHYILALINLQKWWSQELLWPATATTWLIFVTLIKRSKEKLFLSLWSSYSSSILPVKNIIPPLLSVTSQYSGTFHDNIFDFRNEETRMHCPARNSFPPGLHRPID